MLAVKTFDKQKFPEFPFFTYPALIFLDLGVLFGALNAWRVANIFKVPEIHITHWTTTLFGAMTMLMLGLNYFILAQEHEQLPKIHQGMFIVLASLLVTVTIGYMDAWGVLGGQRPDMIYTWAVRTTIGIFVILIILTVISTDFKNMVNSRPELLFILFATFWLAIASIFFNFDKIYVHQLFKTSFIFGFFTLTLFGSLSYLLPILFKLKSRSKSSIYRDLILFNVATTLFMIDDYMDYLDKEAFFLFKIAAPALWGFATFLFILWVFDLMFRAGINLTLGGLLIALIMFGFFVFDSFMKNVFPQWVTANHVHFMFLGTLVMTIISMGLQIVVRKHNYEIPDNMPNWMSIVKKISLGLVLFCVVGVLGSFTLHEILGFRAAGYFGFALFGSLILSETGYILESTKYTTPITS